MKIKTVESKKQSKMKRLTVIIVKMRIAIAQIMIALLKMSRIMIKMIELLKNSRIKKIYQNLNKLKVNWSMKGKKEKIQKLSLGN